MEKGDRITGFYSDGQLRNPSFMSSTVWPRTVRPFSKSGTFTEPKDGKKVCFIFTQGIQASPVENGKVKVDIRNQSQDAPPLLMTAAGVVSNNRRTCVRLQNGDVRNSESVSGRIPKRGDFAPDGQRFRRPDQRCRRGCDRFDPTGGRTIRPPSVLQPAAGRQRDDSPSHLSGRGD